MRILHTIDSIGLYGAESVLLTLALEQQRRGHTPIILSIGNRSAKEKPIENEARVLGIPCIPYRMRDGLNLLGGLRLLGIAERERADVVHSHGYKTNILLGLLPRRARRQPIVTTLHGWTAKRSVSKLGLYRLLDQSVLHRLDAIVVVNDSLKQLECIRRLDAHKVHLIPNGIAVASAPRQVRDDPFARGVYALKASSDFVIVAVGRLSPEKNFGALIEAMRTVVDARPRVRAVIVGAGPAAESLERMVSDHALSENVCFGGYVKHAHLYFGLFDLLVIPSLTEGLPVTLLEAMAADLPVVATAVGDIPKTLGDLGVLVPPGDAAAIAAGILSVIGEYASYRGKASGGSARVRAHYSSKSAADRYDAVYRSLLGSSAAPGKREET